jgi:hypothetical protein
MIALVLACVPALAEAQPPAAGWYVIPSLGLVEEYDSNIFGTRTNEESDFITRFIAGIGLGYRSQPLTLLARYSLAGELYAKNDDLNNVGDRQRASLLFEYHPERRLELRLDAWYGRTNDVTTRFVPEPVAPPSPAAPPPTAPPPAPSPVPGTEGGPEPGVPSPGVASVERGRRLIQVVRVTPSVSYEFTPKDSGEAGYTFRYVDEEGVPTSTEHLLRLAYSRELTRVDSGRITYRFRYFSSDVEDDDLDTFYSNAVTLGWERRWTPLLTTVLEAGPRVDEDDSVGYEARARVSYRLQQATLNLAYSRTQELAAGTVGPQTIDRVAGSVVWRPLVNVVAGLVGSIAWVSPDRIEGSSQDTTIYEVSTYVAYRLTRWLRVRAAYDFRLENDNRPGDIVNHVFSVGLEFEEPFRIY